MVGRLAKRSGRRRGSIYVMALAVALIVGTIGFSTLAVARIRSRAVVGTNDWSEAGTLAYSAVQYALSILESTPAWRTTCANGTPIPAAQRSLGRGTMSAVLVDEYDGDLANYSSDPVRVYGIGRVGNTTRVHSVELRPNKGLEVLKSAVYSGTRIYILSLREILLGGGLMSSNNLFRNEGLVYGSSQALSYEFVNITTGAETTLAAAKPMPGGRPIDVLKSKATTIPCTGNIQGKVLGPGCNPFGTPNQDGLYYINYTAGDITIQSCRFYGTLIIRTGAGTKVRLVGSNFLQSCARGWPTLLVDGNLSIELSSDTTSLSEASANCNFNPAGAPYLGTSDSDTSDTYPNEIQGLIHVTGTVQVETMSRVVGVLLAAGQITFDNTCSILHDSAFYDCPPAGYGDPTRPLVPVPGTWRWDTVP